MNLNSTKDVFRVDILVADKSGRMNLTRHNFFRIVDGEIKRIPDTSADVEEICFPAGF